MKRCCRCGRELPATREYFYADKRASDGLYGHCKACHSATCRKRYEGDAREKTLAAQRQYRKEFPERRKATNKRYYLKNREKLNRVSLERSRSEKGKQYRLRNQEKRRAYRREHYLKYRSRYYVAIRQREAIKRSLPASFTDADWQFALDYFKGCCAACGRPNGLWHTLAADHWIALASDKCPGTIPGNIVPLCHGVGGCNNAKQDRDPLEWLQSQFGIKQAQAINKRVQKFFSLARHVS